MATETAKQQLFYEQVQPMSAKRHGNWSVSGEHSYGFASATNMVPLAVAEFGSAAIDYPIVFSAAGDAALPVAVLGLEAGKSYFVGDDGDWQAKYIPAYVRRYPFILSPIEDGKKFVLCLDEAYDGWDKGGKKGQRLFDDADEQTDYLKDIMKFTNRYQAEHARSLQLGKLLFEHDLLSPMQLKLSNADGESQSIRGFQAVNRDKLKELDANLLADWNKNGILEAIYLHLWSARNFKDLASKHSTPSVTSSAATGANGNAAAEAKPF